MIRTLTLAIVLNALAWSSAALAQQPSADSQSDIVVTGVRPEEIQAFVEQVSTAPPSVDQIARWNDDICVTLEGLPAEQGQIVVDQIAMRSQSVGLQPGRTGCRPNVFVYFVADSGVFTRNLFEERRSLFAYYHEENIATLGREALIAFTDTPRPIRWWHVIQTLGADGDRLGSGQAGNNSPPPPTDAGPPDADGISGAQAVRSSGSRVRSVERQDFNRVVIIVDGRMVEGYPVESIADYVAMVTLAQIDPTAQTRDYPTILNLFDEDPDKVSFVMTSWDTAYLDALYRSTRNAASVNQQVRDISRRMQGDGRS